MNLSFLNKYGWCEKCEKWIKMKKGESWLQDHKGADDKICSNSRYSPLEIRYEVKNIKGAKKLATIIMEDNGKCLISGGLHSMACGDGERCSTKRALLAKALAEFVLKYF